MRGRASGIVMRPEFNICSTKNLLLVIVKLSPMGAGFDGEGA